MESKDRSTRCILRAFDTAAALGFVIGAAVMFVLMELVRR